MRERVQPSAMTAEDLSRCEPRTLPSRERTPEMSDDPSDDTSIPLMDEREFNNFVSGRGWPIGHEAQANFIQRAAAEMNRRLVRSQVKAMEAQRQQLEAQGRQNEAQLEVAKSLKRATWWLSGATIMLALSTIALTAVTALHH
jgi:hypothetical protein